MAGSKQQAPGPVESTAPAGEVAAVRYVGPGYLLGVPARDLTADEWGALTDVQRSAVGWSGIYVIVAEENGEESAE